VKAEIYVLYLGNLYGFQSAKFYHTVYNFFHRSKSLFMSSRWISYVNLR